MQLHKNIFVLQNIVINLRKIDDKLIDNSVPFRILVPFSFIIWQHWRQLSCYFHTHIIEHSPLSTERCFKPLCHASSTIKSARFLTADSGMTYRWCQATCHSKLLCQKLNSSREMQGICENIRTAIEHGRTDIIRSLLEACTYYKTQIFGVAIQLCKALCFLFSFRLR